MNIEPERFGLERQAWAAVWREKRLWLLHVVANAVLLVAGYAWLWIPDERVWHLAGSALLALVLLGAVLWLHAGTLSFFRHAHASEVVGLWPAFRITLRRLPAVLAWLLLFLLSLWLLSWLSGFIPSWSAWLGSALTLSLQKPVSPESMGTLLSALAWLLGWVLLPLLFLPLAVQVADEGFAGFRRDNFKTAWKLFRRKRYWMHYVVLFLVGVYVPYKLVWWVPEVGGLFTQAVTMVVRFLPAYLLVVTAWLTLASTLGRLGSAQATD